MDFPPVDIGPTRVISSHSGVLIEERDFQHRLRKTSIYIYGTEYYEVSEVNRCMAHHKYKRCLAQAQRCMDARCETEADAAFFTRWEHRWLTLAQKFKPNNSTAQ